MSPRTMVVGVDDSPGSHQALRWAAAEAQRTGRELIVVNAYDWHVAGARVEVSGAYIEALRRGAEAVVAAAVGEARAQVPGLVASGQAILGGAARVLADLAGPDDLVVVGSRGRGGFAGLVLGSVSRHVATHARGPVAVVRGRAAADTGPVVVGLDLAGGDNALRVAFEEADSRGTGVVAAHAFVPVDVIMGYGVMPTPEQSRERVAEYRAALAETVSAWSQKYPHVPVDVVVLFGHPVEVLAEMSRTAQLVVVGHRGGGLGEVFLGGVAAGLLHHADCAVLIARGGPERPA